MLGNKGGISNNRTKKIMKTDKRDRSDLTVGTSDKLIRSSYMQLALGTLPCSITSNGGIKIIRKRSGLKQFSVILRLLLG